MRGSHLGPLFAAAARRLAALGGAPRGDLYQHANAVAASGGRNERALLAVIIRMRPGVLELARRYKMDPGDALYGLYHGLQRPLVKPPRDAFVELWGRIRCHIKATIHSEQRRRVREAVYAEVSELTRPNRSAYERAAAREIIGRLRRRQRAILLADARGETGDKIGRRFGISDTAARVRLHVVRRLIAEAA